MKAITTLSQWFKENPQIAAEWDGEANTHLDLETDGMSVNQKAWWICERGHHYDMFVYSRTIDGQGCPYCKGKRTMAGFNDLASKRPDVLAKWDYEKNTELTPQEVTESSHKLVWWKCEQGHSWQARVQSITQLKEGKSGCPYCSGRFPIKGENDLATLFPEVAKEWCHELNGCAPDEVTAQSDRRCWWICEKGHTWLAPVSTRTRKNPSHCPYCNQYKAWPGYNDLATTHSDIAAEWNYERNGDLKPTDVSKGSARKVWWRCSEGHEWETMIRARTKKNGTGCPVCRRRKK